MPESSRNNAAKTRGRPFRPGNSGRPHGARHRITRAAEALLDGQAEALTQKAVALALEGDTSALRLCLERLLPPRKDRPITVALPVIASPDDAIKIMTSLLAAVASGDITPSEAAAVADLVETYRRLFETTEIDRRLAELEKRHDR